MNSSNDRLTLVPINPDCTKFLEYDFPAVKVGVAEYTEGPTGCTVFHFPNTVSSAVDIRGGSPSTFATDNHNFTDFSERESPLL